MAVWVAQCLCGPARHALAACAAEHGEDLKAILQSGVTAMLNDAAINPWCGLCGAPAQDWLYEVTITSFETLDEAISHLSAAEAAQVQARARLHAEGRSYDSQRRN